MPKRLLLLLLQVKTIQFSVALMVDHLLIVSALSG